MERLEKALEKTPHPQKLTILKQITLHQRLAILFYVQSNMLYRMLDIKDAISKLPDKREFDNVKSQVKAHENKIESTLAPIKELYEDYREREKRGEALYE